jgi:hypothetical protein
MTIENLVLRDLRGSDLAEERFVLKLARLALNGLRIRLLMASLRF